MRNEIQHREYRGVANFSAEEVRRLTPGPLDAISLGCPVDLFARVLEKRAIRRGLRTSPRVVAQPAIASDADRRARAARVTAAVAADRIEDWRAPEVVAAPTPLERFIAEQKRKDGLL